MMKDLTLKVLNIYNNMNIDIRINRLLVLEN